MEKGDNHIRSFRSFNRFYTKTIGLMKKRFLESDYTLIQARVLHEIGTEPNVFAKDLAQALALDPAHLSKILKSFHNSGLIDKMASPNDARRQILSLTLKGKNVLAELEAISNKETGKLIENLSEEQLNILFSSMRTIKNILQAKQPVPELVVIRSFRPGDIGYIAHRHGVIYSQEYGFDLRFDGYLAKGIAEFIESFDPKHENMWIAEVGGVIKGAIAIVRRNSKTAQLRWLIVEKDVRAMGIGKSLLNEAIKFARNNEYDSIYLWTIDFLHAARSLYSKALFRLVETKQSHVWGKELVEEKWELEL